MVYISDAGFGAGYEPNDCWCVVLRLWLAAAGFAFIAVMGFAGLAPLFFRKDKQKVQLDERDLLIKRKAMLAAYWTFWPLFVLAAMAPFFVLGPDGKVSVLYLAWMVFGGMFYVTLIQAIATLQEYGWREKGEKP